MIGRRSEYTTVIILKGVFEIVSYSAIFFFPFHEP